MAVKTITIDMDAYEMLAASKLEDESFSRVIKRRFRKGTTGENLLNRLDEICLSKTGLRGVEKVVRARRESLAESRTL